MEVEITVRVRAIIPDGLHLPRLAVDKNLDIPLIYLEGTLPPAYSVGITPHILTVQHAIVNSQGNNPNPLNALLDGDSTPPRT